MPLIDVQQGLASSPCRSRIRCASQRTRPSSICSQVGGWNSDSARVATRPPSPLSARRMRGENLGGEDNRLYPAASQLLDRI